MPDTHLKIDDTELSLSIPADPALLRIVRLVASGLASFTDLDLNGVEELRVGADELVSALIQAGDGSPVNLRAELRSGRLCIEADTVLGGEALQVDPLTDRILAEVSTDHSFTVADGRVHGRLELEI